MTIAGEVAPGRCRSISPDTQQGRTREDTENNSNNNTREEKKAEMENPEARITVTDEIKGEKKECTNRIESSMNHNLNEVQPTESFNKWIIEKPKKTHPDESRDIWESSISMTERVAEKIYSKFYILWQVVSSCGCGLVFAAMMSSWSLPAVALPEMALPDSPVSLTPTQANWFASVPLLMCIPGSALGGMACERVGPRKLQLLLAPVLAVSLALMALGTSPAVLEGDWAPTVLLGCRVLQGIVVALLLSLTSVYPCEVSDEGRRGTLTSLTDAWASLGLLLPYLMGRYLSWPTICWLLPLVTLLPGFLLLLVAPESPLWLARKGREDDAWKAFAKVRRTQHEAREEFWVARQGKEVAPGLVEAVRVATQRQHLQPIIISTLILVLKQVSGSSALIVYIVRIFQEAGVGGLDPHWCSVLVGATRLLCNFFGTSLISRFPRKALLTTGIVVSGVATSATAAFFYVRAREGDVSGVTWVPVASLVLLMLGYSAGVSPAAWLVSVEILPDAVRSVGFGFGLTCYSVTSFVVAKTFDDVVAAWGLHGVFCAYAGGTVAYALLVLLCVPETKGKTRQEIERIWYGDGGEGPDDTRTCV